MKHMQGDKARRLECMSQVADGARAVHWFCNECGTVCDVASPPLKSAVKELQTAVFEEFNKIPEDYNTRLRDAITDADLLYIICCLP